MKLSSRALALPLLLAAAVLPACSLFGNGSHSTVSPTLITAPNSPIADVPIPAGFALIKGESTSKVIPASNVRFVDHLYSGNDDLLPVVSFYRDQLPATGWALVDQTQSKADITLHFTKGSEDCFVTVTSGSLVKNTHIRIRIDPIARGTMK
jgi:hypothetical protein